MILFLIPVMEVIQPGAYRVQAERVLLLSQAKVLALSNSRDYKRTKSKIALKQVKYTEAVKSIQLKKKNMSTFRWTPLLSFKFPTKADLADEYEFTYKPLQIQSEISNLQHQLSDQVYEVYEKVSNLYTQIYTAQERLAFEQEQLQNMEKVLNKNRTRLLFGEASQNDIDTMEKSISTLTKKIASDMRAFETAKQELSDLIKLDVTTGYTFVSPYQDFQVTRSNLDSLVNYTLERSQTYYEAKMSTQMALISLDTNYNLMYSQYGSKMNRISNFIRQAKTGADLDTDAFKAAYDNLLYDVDSPWQGKKRILFIRIPREWFKGEIDGVRYVEDEPYALYTAALDYQEALKDQEDTRKELEKEVRDSFEALVTARNAYLSLEEQVKTSRENLDKAGYLNSLGEMTYEEYKSAEDEYSEYQMDALDSLDFYTQSLYSFDRLTCGGITSLMQGDSLELDAVSGGMSYVVEDMVDGAYYYIQSKVEDNVFEMGIYLPEDYEIEVTAFELWCDGVQIGERTAVGKTLRHLTLSLESVEKVFIRLYNEDKFVDDCDIDPQEYRGKLSVTGSYRVEKKEGKRTVAEYRYTTNAVTGLVTLTLDQYEAEGIAYYKIKNEAGEYLVSEELTAASKPFSYLSMLLADLKNVTVELYDEQKNLLYEGYFDTDTMTVYTQTE
ncbi:MAG: TolC family protein [Lachnospiraceae bacterium]|nr:TolC family protein [Lachnospiraceae bacterium]